MMFAKRLSGRLVLAALAVTCSSAAAPQTKAVSPECFKVAAVQTAPQGDAVAYHEVRLRKLHLVRPDLIPYPIALEIYC